jgi:hypothetical protein
MKVRLFVAAVLICVAFIAVLVGFAKASRNEQPKFFVCADPPLERTFFSPLKIPVSFSNAGPQSMLMKATKVPSLSEGSSPRFGFQQIRPFQQGWWRLVTNSQTILIGGEYVWTEGSEPKELQFTVKVRTRGAVLKRSSYAFKQALDALFATKSFTLAGKVFRARLERPFLGREYDLSALMCLDSFKDEKATNRVTVEFQVVTEKILTTPARDGDWF